MERFTAIVLAGDRSADDPQAGAIPGRKALLPILGQPMLGHVLSALSGARQIGDIFVVANRVQEIQAGLRAGEATRKVRFIEGAASPVTSVLKTIEKLKPPFPMLIATADNPLLSAAEIDDFCQRSRAAERADVTVAIAEKSKLLRLHPEVRRSFIGLKGDGYKGCNLFALLTPAALSGVRFWRGVEADRKKAFAIVAAFGAATLFKFLIRQLTLEAGFARASEVIGATITPLIMENPRLAMDVDTPEHAALVEEILTAGANS